MCRPIALVICVAFSAWATPTFPRTIASHLDLAAPPAQSCSLCHINGVTAADTATTPFARSARAQGLARNNDGSLETALDALARSQTDSDGDGVSDIDELRAGTDPNVNGASARTGDPDALVRPAYGCGANTVPGAFGALSVLALSGLRRRRRVQGDSSGGGSSGSSPGGAGASRSAGPLAK